MNLPSILRRTIGREKAGRGGDERISEEHVVWAYRLLLDRLPESAKVVREKLAAWQTPRELRRDLLSSAEFREKNQDLAYSIEAQLVIKELPDRGRLFVDLSDVVIGLNVVNGTYERDEVEFVRRTVKAGDHVVDVGAHIGFFTITLASLVGANGRVFAFEPHGPLADLLQRSVAENRFEDRVVFRRAAAGEQPGEIDLVFIRHTLNSGGSYRLREGTPVPPAHEIERVPVLALDRCDLARPIHFMKVDVEGSEPFVFRGAQRILAEDRPVILSEVHRAQLQRVANSTPRDLLRDMERMGYECRLLQGANPGQRVLDVENVASVVFLPR